MRNAVDHPGGSSGTIIIHNVRAHPQGLIPPAWSRGGPESDIFSDMKTAMDNMLTIAEDWLIACIEKTSPFGVIAFYQIPEAERDAKCPRAGLKPELQASLAKKDADANP